MPKGSLKDGDTPINSPLSATMRNDFPMEPCAPYTLIMETGSESPLVVTAEELASVVGRMEVVILTDPNA
jgi:hypothetical protein